MEAPIPNVPRYVPNYLVQAILTTVFCCLPFGIVAIVFAAQVNGKLAAEDFSGAMQTSSQAKMWCWLGFGIGLVCQIIPLLFWLLFVGFAVVNGHAMPPRHF